MTPIRTVLAAAMLAALFLPAAPARADLRRCPATACGQVAFSDAWRYCPACGTGLPTPAAHDGERETVLGNVYRNPQAGFSIERPAREWQIVTRARGLAELNADAVVGMHRDDVYTIVIVERMPEASLEDYAALVAPKLAERVKVAERQLKVDGVTALQTEWHGRGEGIPFVFFSTILERAGTFYQVVSWCAKGNDAAPIRAAVDAIAKSVRFVEAAPERRAAAPTDG